MGKSLLFHYFVALSLLIGLAMIATCGGSQMCAPACTGQTCNIYKNDCRGPCKCQQFSAGSVGTCVSCQAELCGCSMFTISDAPSRSCCSGLQCVGSKSTGQGICRRF